ncbi:MAG: non-canonical purine NTP pyrophosphatase [Verrucomicrobia bacterium]|nr:non-canonical purine NTP pyrophosphatase [Verrucomicrobiota bacterium]
MTILLIATRNRHKAREIQAILPDTFDCRTLADFPDAPAVVEDAPDFAGNASKKAVALARWLLQRGSASAWPPGSRLFVLADDSGLEVDALGGAPGVHSARFAALDAAPTGGGSPARNAGNSADAANNAKLLRLLATVPRDQRTAQFRCVLALVQAHPPPPSAEAEIRLFEGVCEGHIEFAPRGQSGFGYDPLFVPTGHARTFAELGETVKNRLSHRACALGKLKAWLVQREPQQ